MMSQEHLLKTTMAQTNNEVTVYLDQDQATQFIAFQENYVNFVILAENKVFEQRGAAITLHIDPLGIIRSIQRADSLYDYRADFVNNNPKRAKL